MKAGTPVREHVLMMNSLIQEIEINGETMDEDTQVGMILENLSPKFLQFKSNYFLSKLSYDLTQLPQLLSLFLWRRKRNQMLLNLVPLTLLQRRRKKKKCKS